MNLPSFRFRRGLLYLILLINSLLLSASAVPVSESPAAGKRPARSEPCRRPAARKGWVLLLALFLPPVAVVVWQDGVVTRWFWFALLLTLLGFLPGLLYALYVIGR